MFEKEMQDLIFEVRGQELRVLDDFCKAHLAAQSHITGKDLLGIIQNLELNHQTLIEDGKVITKHWFTCKDLTCKKA